MMQYFQHYLRRKPFIIFSVILIIYTILQLLISYHLIEIEFGDHHMIESHKKSDKKQIPKTSDAASSLLNDHNPSHLHSGSPPDFESHRFEGCDPIPIDYEWGQKRFTNQRIACLVLSLYPRNKILMQFIGETFGPRCDGLYFILDDSKTHWFNKTLHSESNDRKFRRKKDIHHENKQIIDAERNLTHLSTYFGGRVIQLNLTRPSHHKERNTWEKVHRMYTYFYVHHLHEYDWFVRIDDDVLVSMVNLRDYLSFFDAQSAPYYIGHTLLDRFRDSNIVYNAGNLHVINGRALSMMGPVFMTLPTGNVHDAHAHCMDFVAGNDDPHFGTCLNAMGIYPLNTMDYQLKNRFMVFTNRDHYRIKKEKSWYWEERPLDMGSMDKCCNVFALNDHPWIGSASHLEWRLTFIGMSDSKWNNESYIESVKKEYLSKGAVGEVIPPKPCSFMYSIRNETFKVDQYYNVDDESIPKGQRISRGTADTMICHRCNIGDQGDVHWNNEWDRTGLIDQIHDENKHKFYDIMQFFPDKLISTRFDVDPETKRFVIAEAGDEADILQTLINQALDPTVKAIIPP